ncbi:MAG: MmgE/PrpD family protein, partial [Oscillospiraceae bacterium]
IADNSFKLYPCCRHTHSGIYSMEKLIATHSPNLSDIVKIVDRTYSAAKDVTDRADASTPYACKFSMQYCLSAVLARGRFESCIFDDDAVNDPVVRGIMQKVEVVDDPAIDAELARDPACWSNTVEVTLCDGRVLTESTDYPPGDSHTNLSWDAATEKFHSLTDELIGRERALQLADKIGSLDDLDDVNRLFG